MSFQYYAARMLSDFEKESPFKQFLPRRSIMADKVKSINKTPEQVVEDLFKEGSKELTSELTKGMVTKIKEKMKQRTSAAKILQNIDREIEMMKVELVEEIKSLSI